MSKFIQLHVGHYDTKTTELPTIEQYNRAFKNAELIAWLTQLRDTKRFPIERRPTDWFIDHILEELK